MDQNIIGPVRLWMSSVNIAWGMLWGGMGVALMGMFSYSLIMLGVPAGVLLVLLVPYTALLLFLKLVCSVSVALPVDEVVAKLEMAGFKQKSDGSLVLRCIGIPSSKVQVFSEGEACCLRGSRQMLWKAVGRLERVV